MHDYGVQLSGHKSYPTLDTYASGLGSSMFPPGVKHGLLPNGHGLTQPRNFQSGPQYHSQTPFGPHLPANGSAAGGSVLSAPTVSHVSGGQGSSQEEISTIFVVGFPDDMQEREFQNMFTFSPGFEAATLKIPNKELTAYGSGVGPMRPSYSQGYQGPNDPYNLVTVNQGGVVVDGGRDGTTASWPAAPTHDDSHFVQSGATMPPRKQIIGFAKFSTRSEALAARDVLQGRRVDAEKGAVLKAEMAKKNLHTKRGVGQASLPGMTSLLQGSGMTTDMLNNGLAGLGSPTSAGEALSARDRELGPLGTMGIGRRDRFMSGDEDPGRDGRRSDLMGMMSGLNQYNTRGPRERAEDDERERERAKRELRLRQANSSAYEAFHSVPSHLVRSPDAAMAENGASYNGLNALSHSLSDGTGMSAPSNPWGMPTREAMANGLNGIAARRQAMPFSSYPQRPPSASQSSVPDQDIFPSTASRSTSSSQSGLSDPEHTPHTNPDAALSPPTDFFLPMGVSRSHGRSPSTESQQLHDDQIQPLDASGAGPQMGNEQQITHAMSDLAIGTETGSTSPDLPSPTSNASSGNRNAADQNPPINTLYVGNLPASPTQAGYPSSHLEDGLRDLFSQQPGFRKLCYRQKSNGPMCFVEFEDVSYATKALNDLYGNTVNGLVKAGGIRLSYSKNPLGVRTPTSATHGSNSGSPFQSDAFLPRSSAVDMDATPRRDTIGSSYYQAMSTQPPRFSAGPSSSIFGVQNAQPTFPRGNFGPGPGNLSTSFSPFGISSSPRPIPDANNNEPNDHLVASISALTST
ncbi:hypothetical protein PUNSTDRAFT_51626 [Punctularia strigosozonata HHB-11173 SS5]|uniref:uncharacterized protein n=1 Tax=Punctularia strigosozonata (strain HHB-11173) TaxID=741275 RepID=UPI000441724C|nr:uncharacterized protein PUNSTDRAFT_51626 [Punctularia strigosozonata HHB-11173 SS5]EIN11068.1 hypothetical protein PUNSTDRAFT_51626 [Punctularia strigosozonata HHB-11173 SS5]